LILTFQSLCSGSSGNSLLLKTDRTTLLIDAGFPSLRAGRNALNGNLPAIDGAVISHLHSDHIQYASLRLLEESRIPIYLYERDIKPLASRHFRQSPFLDLKIRPFSEQPFPIGDFSIHPFRLPHDGVRPTFGFAIGVNRKGRQRKVVVATDFRDWGGLSSWFANSDFIYVEANHDPELLRAYPNPHSYFHLSNEKCGRLLRQAFVQSRTRPSILMLGHLSEKRNRPRLAQETVSGILADGGYRDIKIQIAPRYEPSASIPIDG
jgi:phosphoribosyl 1,2-cyclic phosphodiesterase